MHTRKILKSATASDGRKRICQYDRKGLLGYDTRINQHNSTLMVITSGLALDK